MSTKFVKAESLHPMVKALGLDGHRIQFIAMEHRVGGAVVIKYEEVMTPAEWNKAMSQYPEMMVDKPA